MPAVGWEPNKERPIILLRHNSGSLFCESARPIGVELAKPFLDQGIGRRLEPHHRPKTKKGQSSAKKLFYFRN